MTKSQQNEGEGNRTAARRYTKKTTEFAQSHDTEKLGKQARKAREGAQGDALRKAEEQGRRRSHGEDPAVER
ncbi:MAG: hypothetical protein RLO50_01130 [Azospirillaceae bacterium]